MRRYGVLLCAVGTGLVVMAAGVPGEAAPALAVDARVGTLGYGGDVAIGLVDNYLGVRLGYSAFSYNRTISQTDVSYDGRLKIDDPAGMLDWFPFHGGFHLSIGAVGNGLSVDATGRPTGGSYTLNGHTYSASQLGTLSGTFKFGNSVSPYVGFGWGNPVGLKHHLHVLFDIGGIYGGTPNVALTGTCGPAAPSSSALCTQLQSDVQAERAKLTHDVTILKWYPVVDLGLAYRF